MNLRKSAFVSLAVAAFGVSGVTLFAAAERGGAHFFHGGGHFEKLDTDGDGTVTRDEVEAVRVEKFSAADSNGDGTISVEEFTAAAEAREAERRAERHARMFERLDKDSDGTLSAAELTMPVDHMFERVDENGDGVITEAERDAVRERMRERWGERRGGEHGPRNWPHTPPSGDSE
ncbi:MAG: EF-hand domain-containing protein [Hyphomonadaceae bacterium]|nr:EF-hand domain-containing protein [Hyphomonadaceae bacterium]